MNPVAWFEIYVENMQRARAFYESLLELELQPLDSPDAEIWAFPMRDREQGAPGALVKAQGMVPGKNSVLVYFACEDCANTQIRVESAGGKVIRPKMSTSGHGFVSLFLDTEGNMVGLHSME